MSFCIGCHGADAKGNQALGAPNLTDSDWLHGATDADIRDVLMKGRSNQMPAQRDILTPDRIRVLVAYVLSLGEQQRMRSRDRRTGTAGSRTAVATALESARTGAGCRTLALAARRQLRHHAVLRLRRSRSCCTRALLPNSKPPA